MYRVDAAFFQQTMNILLWGQDTHQRVVRFTLVQQMQLQLPACKYRLQAEETL